MAKLVLSLNGKILAEYPLDQQRVTLGRKSYNDVRIDNLAVSGDHAVVTNVYDYHFIEDLGSTNGTYVNDKLVKRQLLKHNDTVRIGKHLLTYVNPQQSGEEEEFEKTVVIDAESMREVDMPTNIPGGGNGSGAPDYSALDAETQPISSLDQDTEPLRPDAAANEPDADEGAEHAVPNTGEIPAAEQPAVAKPAAPKPSAAETFGAPLPSAPAFLKVLNSAASGKMLKLTMRSTTIGRQGAPLAIILQRDDGYYITPGAAATAPVVNGESVDAQRLLQHHDVIELDNIKMEFNVGA